MLKQISLFLLALMLGASFAACNNDQTYGDLRDKENAQINAFLGKGCTILDPETGATRIVVAPNIKVISEAEFAAQDSTTNIAQNEYVLLAGSGVYMQIVRKGSGSSIKSGETVQLISRFTEFNIATDTMTISNIGARFVQWADVMNVTNTLGTYSGSFSSGLMYSTYNSSTIPAAWLMALPFIRVGRQTTSEEEIAKVRLIVPSTQGHLVASNAVTPYFYEITYQRSR